MMDDLDALFAQAKSQPMQPSAGVMARVLADAAAHQTQSAPPQTRRKPGLFAQIADFFGGVGALAGMASAAMAGLVIGIVQPTSFEVMTGYVAGSALTEQVELLPDVTALLTGE